MISSTNNGLGKLSQAHVGSVRVIGTPDIVTKRLDDESDIAREIEAGLNEQWDDLYEEHRFKSHAIIVDYTEIRRYVCRNAKESRVMWDWFEGRKIVDEEKTERCTVIKWMAHMDKQATADLWKNGQTDWAVYHVEEDR